MLVQAKESGSYLPPTSKQLNTTLAEREIASTDYANETNCGFATLNNPSFANDYVTD